VRIKLGVLIAVLLSPIAAHGHAEIFFPKLFSPAELPTTGFVFVNPDPFTATVYFYLIPANGGKALSPTPITIPSGGQLSKLGSELFPNATTSGWVYIINDSESMQAFWLNYDAGLTFLDGAEAAQYDALGADQIIPLVAGHTEVNVINPTATTVPLTIRIFGEDHELAAAFTASVLTAGAFQAQASDMFPAADMTQARYIRIQTPGAPVASSAVIRGYLVPKDSAVVNGLNVGTKTELSFPHAVNGQIAGANYTTVVGVTNLSNSSQTVTMTFNPNAGDPLVVNRTIPGNGALRETAQSLFGLSSAFQSGWIRVNSTTGIVGFAAYADSVSGGIAAVPASTPLTDLFFSHIADGPPQWQTGLALLNASNTAATVEVYAVNPSGSLIGSKQFTLDPGMKIANVIHELIPETRGVNGGFVYVRTANNIPIYGIELFYTEDLKVLSNVAAGKLMGGVKYSPPKS